MRRSGVRCLLEHTIAFSLATRSLSMSGFRNLYIWRVKPRTNLSKSGGGWFFLWSFACNSRAASLALRWSISPLYSLPAANSPTVAAF